MIMASRSHTRFQDEYLEACRRRETDPLPGVLEACKSCSSTLNLSGHCLTVDNCMVLGKCLYNGHPFQGMNFSDCLMGDEGLSKIESFLWNDKQVTCICLKGNNLRKKGAEVLGRILKHNGTTESLSLEWNSLGVGDSGIKLLSEGLAVNQSLKSLDLRSNHISHTGITFIASALDANTTLEELDLRWNNAGVTGGRALLSSLKYSASLMHVCVEGNNIPADIMEAISATMSARCQQLHMESKHQVKVEQLSSELQQLHKDSKIQFMDLIGKVDAERSAFLETTQRAQMQLSELKAEVQQRDVTIADLNERIKETESALQLRESQCQEFIDVLAKVRMEKDVIFQQSSTEVVGLKKKFQDLEQEKRREDLDSSIREKQLQQKVVALEAEMQLLEERNKSISEEFAKHRSESQYTIKSVQDQMSAQDHRYHEQLLQMHSLHSDEISKLTEQYKSNESTLLKNAKEAQAKSTQLEQEVGSLHLSLEREKTKATEELERTQHSLKMQSLQNKHLEQQQNKIQKWYDDGKVRITELESKVRQLQAEKDALDDELLVQKHRCNELNKKLQFEQQQWSMTHKQQQEESAELSKERDSLHKFCKDLKLELEKQKKRNSELQECNELHVKELQQENSDLKQAIERQKALVQQIRQDEVHRASLLKTALHTYLSTSTELD